VSHFRRSANAKSRLDNIQRQQGNEPKKLIRDVVTQWNSTYLMLRRFVELEGAVKTTLALIDAEFLPVIPAKEWKFMKELIMLLKPFYDVTELMSGEKFVTLSLIIIVTNGLLNVYNEMKNSNRFGDLSTNFIENLREDITTRLGDLEASNTLIISTCLDPRFKGVGFIKPGTFEKAKQIVINLVAQRIRTKPRETTPGPDNPEISEQAEAVESNSQQTFEFDIWKQLDHAVSSQPTKNQSPQARAIVEVNRYVEEGILSRHKDPLKWWADHAVLFPNLNYVVQNKFGTVATSVPCECVFSKTGILISERRNR
jgi:hypothetical protein